MGCFTSLFACIWYLGDLNQTRSKPDWNERDTEMITFLTALFFLYLQFLKQRLPRTPSYEYLHQWPQTLWPLILKKLPLRQDQLQMFLWFQKCSLISYQQLMKSFLERIYDKCLDTIIALCVCCVDHCLLNSCCRLIIQLFNVFLYQIFKIWVTV